MKISKKEISDLLPHREPMLLIDELVDIKKLHSATAIMNVKKNAFYVDGHFPGNPVLPGVLIVEAFGQAAAALTAHGIDKKEYDNKLVFLMSIEKARFRNPVIPDCKLELNIEATRSHGRVWKYKGEAFVEGIDGLSELLEAIKEASKKGYIKSIDGRHIKVDSPHKSLNSLLQSSAAVVAKRWMVITNETIKQTGLCASQLAFIHDELQYECTPEHAADLCTSLGYSSLAAGEYYNLRVPIASEAKQGNTWAEVH